jgi:regulator of replication initiation timing
MAPKLQRISLASVTYNDDGQYCYASQAQSIIDELEEENDGLRRDLADIKEINRRISESNSAPQGDNERLRSELCDAQSVSRQHASRASVFLSEAILSSKDLGELRAFKAAAANRMAELEADIRWLEQKAMEDAKEIDRLLWCVYARRLNGD